MNNDIHPLANYRWVLENIIDMIGAEPLWARYPTLGLLHERIDAEGSTDDAAAQSLEIALFAAIRKDAPPQPDYIDLFLLNAARLDLQRTTVLPEYRYRHDGSASDKALGEEIGKRMNLPFQHADYLCHLSYTHRYLYVATPKVACTWLKEHLQQLEMHQTMTSNHIGDVHRHHLSPLLSPVDNPGLYFEAMEGDSWFRFTFVRDPFDRALSCYIDKVVNAATERRRLLPELGLDPADGIPSFGDFLRAVQRQPEDLRDVHWAAQSWLTQPESMNYHLIGRLEHFDRDFATVCQALAVTPPTTTTRLHSTGAASRTAEFYGTAEIALVREIYAQDFEVFGYDAGRL